MRPQGEISLGQQQHTRPAACRPERPPELQLRFAWRPDIQLIRTLFRPARSENPAPSPDYRFVPGTRSLRWADSVRGLRSYTNALHTPAREMDWE